MITDKYLVGLECLTSDGFTVGKIITQSDCHIETLEQENESKCHRLIFFNSLKLIKIVKENNTEKVIIYYINE